MDTHDWILVAFGIVQLVLLGSGIYFKQYLIKKADLKASNENFDKLITQLSQTTELTKSIEGRLGNTAWLVQQKWEIKKEFYIESMALFNEMNDCYEKIHKLRLDSLKKQKTVKIQMELDNGIDNKIDHALEVISDKYDRLKNIVDLTGVLFLKPDVLDVINIYLDAEKNRTNKIYSQLSKERNQETIQQAASEIHSFDLYLDNQAHNCSDARDKLLISARTDLNLVWEET